jgi:hypothetical protein
MERHDHLRLPKFISDVERQKKKAGGGYSLPDGREKSDFSKNAQHKADKISQSFADLKQKFAGRITPSLIYEIEINQSVAMDTFEKSLSSMGIHVLSIAENRKGFWVVFSDDEKLNKFKEKLDIYGSETGAKHDFFNAISTFRDIPREKKIGKGLKEKPLGKTPEFIDIELWKMTDPRKNERFIQELKQTCFDHSQFRVTDTLITKTFVLLRVKLTASVFDEIIDFKEISRADRPGVHQFNPFEYTRPDVSEIKFSAPDDSAYGILIVDSGITSNHPMLEKCVGGEENFQDGEPELQDTVGHGTAVAGCAAYGDIEKCLLAQEFTPANWVFSAKVLYSEQNAITGKIHAIYDPEKLVEHQLKNAVESFLSVPEYHIRVVNIALGNRYEIWQQSYFRQLPLAAMIDELAFDFPNVVFLVSAGNQDPTNSYNTIADICSNYPVYLTENPCFRIINPATASLALTIGSIAGDVRIESGHISTEKLRTPIAEKNQPSPFTRSGFGINGMIKPELVEYGGNLILFDNYGMIAQDRGGKIPLLNNRTTEDIIQYDCGTSFATPKVACLAGRISNQFPKGSGNFIKNMLLMGATYPFLPSKDFYQTETAKESARNHLAVCGFGVSSFERAVNSFDNRVILWDEGQIGLNQLKVYSLSLPDIFFAEPGKKRIVVTLTFNPETRLTRGDSYLGNRMEFHVFHSINPRLLIEKYGVVNEQTESTGVPENLKKFEIDFFPGANARKAGCHQKAWKEYKKEPGSRPSAPISLVLLNFNKWIVDDSRLQDYCISVAFEHEKEIALYNEIKASIQTRVRVDF